LIAVINRNQYDVLENIFASSAANQDCGHVLIWDDGSEPEELKKAAAICDRYSFELKTGQSIGVSSSVQELSNLSNDEWLFVCQSDVSFPQQGFFNSLNSLIPKIPDEVATIGFNVLDDGFHSEAFVDSCKKTQRFPVGIVGRCNLAPDARDLEFQGWYRCFDEPFKRPRLDVRSKYQDQFYRVEVVSWHMIGLRIKALREINIDTKFNLILSFDDISYQLMLRGYSNACCSSLTVYHQPKKKAFYGVPNSKTGCNTKYFVEGDPNGYWRKKWGFPWGCRRSRVSIKEHNDRRNFVMRNHTGTILDKLTRVRIEEGPDKAWTIK